MNKKLPENYEEYQQQESVDYGNKNNCYGEVYYKGYICEFAIRASIDGWIEVYAPQCIQGTFHGYPISTNFTDSNEGALKFRIISQQPGDIIILSIDRQGNYIEKEKEKEIKFRAERKEGIGLVYGYYVKLDNRHYIHQVAHNSINNWLIPVEIIRSTLERYIGEKYNDWQRI